MDIKTLTSKKLAGQIPMDWPLFKEGEVIELKGIIFRIAYTNGGRKSMTLTPTSCEDILAEALFAKG